MNVTLLPRLSLGGSHTNLSCKQERVGFLATSSTAGENKSLVYDSVHGNLKLGSRHEEGAFLQIFNCNFLVRKETGILSHLTSAIVRILSH